MYYLFKNLTIGEKRFVQRKRDRISLTPETKKLEEETTITNQIHLELWEECLVYMRRNDIMNKDIMNQMGVCKATVIYWKQGKKDYDRLFERLMDDKDKR